MAAYSSLFGVALCILFAMIAYPILQIVLRFLHANGIVAPNYRGDQIPVSTGLYFAVLIFIFFILWRIGTSFGLQVLFASPEFPYGLFVLLVFLVFFVGWLDDSIGDRTVKGFKGHIRKWRDERVVTTGLLKAVSIAFISLWTVWELHYFGLTGDGVVQMSISSPDWDGLAGRFVGHVGLLPEMGAGLLQGIVTLLIVFMQWLLMTLSANTLNLLDLRPGRALKFALLVVLLIVLFGRYSAYFPFLFPIVIGIVWLFPSDVRGQSMLGDAGANLLGYTLGFCVVLTCPLWLQLAVLSGFAVLHWLAERMAISRYIEANRWLRVVDGWGTGWYRKEKIG